MPSSAATFSAVSGIEVDAVRCAHQRIDEAPADRGVVHLGACARERASRPWASRTARGSCSRRRRRSIESRPRRCGWRAPPWPTASRPEPHRRLTVAPGTSTGSPASSAAMRATLRLSSPAWLAQPKMTSSTRRPVDVRVALHQRPDRNGGEVVGAHRCERAAVAADRRADGVADEGFAHGFRPSPSTGGRPWNASSSSARMPSRVTGRGL